MRNRTENQITLIFIRHGETAANKEQRYLGRTEEALSLEGREKLLLPFDYVSSPVPVRVRKQRSADKIREFYHGK